MRSKVPWKRGDGAQSFILVQNRRCLSSSLTHVSLHRIELRHGPAVRLPWSPLNHVAAILWSPESGVTAKKYYCKLYTRSATTKALVSLS